MMNEQNNVSRVEGISSYIAEALVKEDGFLPDGFSRILEVESYGNLENSNLTNTDFAQPSRVVLTQGFTHPKTGLHAALITEESIVSPESGRLVFLLNPPTIYDSSSDAEARLVLEGNGRIFATTTIQNKVRPFVYEIVERYRALYPRQ